MKKLSGLLFLALILSASVRAEFQSLDSPDILLVSRLDGEFSEILVKKFRKLLKMYKIDDPFEGKIQTPILVNESVIGNFLPKDSKEIVRDLGTVIGLNILKAETKVYMHGFSYEVKGFKTDLQAKEKLANGLVMALDFSASEVNLSADKVSLTLTLPGQGKSASPVITIDVVKPTIKARGEKLINFLAHVKIQDQKDFHNFQIIKASFDQMSKNLLSRPQDIELTFERIVVPKVTLKVGSKEIDFSPAKIEALLRSKKNAIKGILVAQVASLLKSNTAQAALKVVERYKLNKEFWFHSSTIQTQLGVSKFLSSISHNHIEVQIPGDFCTGPKFATLSEKCVHSKVTKAAESRLGPDEHAESLQHIRDLFYKDEANIIASISEDYFNKLVVTTIDAGLWTKTLEESAIALGPNQVMVRLDKEGESATLILDVVYTPTKKERIFTGAQVIRFPLVMDVSLKIEKKKETPFLVVRLNSVDTTDDTLVNGRPEYGVSSTIKDIPRLKKKVLKAVKEKLSTLHDKDLVVIPYPELTGLGLESVDFVSDGLGRMNALMRLEELVVE